MHFRPAVIALACIALAACGGTRQTPPVLPSAHGIPRKAGDAGVQAPGIAHITVIVMENVSYENVIGSADAPYLNSLAARSALFTASHGVTHPSEPNYLALFSGSTQGVTTDACPLTFDGDNLAAQLAANGLTFAGYAEDAPATGNPCFAAPSDSVSSGYLYWRKHAPWTDFTNAPNAAAQPYTPGVSLANAVNFIVPDICNDMHDCSVATGDAWLAQNVPAIQAYDAANGGLLIVTFDEGEYSPDNHIATMLNGPMVNAGSYSQTIDHYAILRLIETAFGLPLLGQSASAADITGVLGETSSTPSPSPPPPDASFTRTGTVGQLDDGFLHVQFGRSCGWLHVFASAQTVYSPSSWRPAVGDTITVYGTGSCAVSATATQIVQTQAAQTTP